LRRGAGSARGDLAARFDSWRAARVA